MAIAIISMLGYWSRSIFWANYTQAAPPISTETRSKLMGPAGEPHLIIESPIDLEPGTNQQIHDDIWVKVDENGQGIVYRFIDNQQTVLYRFQSPE